MSQTLRQNNPVSVIDSHTGGEPTRVVLTGAPELGNGPLAERKETLAEQFDSFRTSIILEPRGNAFLVGALLCEPVNPSCVAGVIFFNNVGYLGMCVHGLIGVVETLTYLGRLATGVNRIETPVGPVVATRDEEGNVTVRNVMSFRSCKDVELCVPDHGTITGDVAWGGNWFFLVSDHGQSLELSNASQLSDFCEKVRQALVRDRITGLDGAEIDHVELFGPASNPSAHSKNFVLCPGGAYDRSPCGTGTSAKIACLIADGVVKPGETWCQESITGSVFHARAELEDKGVIPSITGRAFVCAEATLVFDKRDPIKNGIES